MTTAVPSIRDVKRGRADWWPADQIGKPLTPTMCYWLRKSLYKAPMPIVRGLARRGLHAGMYAGQRERYRTELGERITALLGIVPEQYAVKAGYRRHPEDPITRTGAALEPIICQRCGAFVPAELIAWGTPLRQCITCATKEQQP